MVDMMGSHHLALYSYCAWPEQRDASWPEQKRPVSRRQSDLALADVRATRQEQNCQLALRMFRALG